MSATPLTPLAPAYLMSTYWPTAAGVPETLMAVEPLAFKTAPTGRVNVAAPPVPATSPAMLVLRKPPPLELSPPLIPPVPASVPA